MTTYNQQWETAKAKFASATGVKKPKPDGFFKAFFNHTGLTSALEDTDAIMAKIESAKPDDRAKLVGTAEGRVPKLGGAIADYLKILDKHAKDEKSDANEKTQLYRHLKILSGELKLIDAKAVQMLDQHRTQLIKGIDAKERAGKVMKTSLASAIAAAALAVKKVQTDPKLATFDEFFNKVSDTPGRKIQVQLLAAAKLLKLGQLPSLREDPEYVASMFNPWQGQNSPKSVLPPNATPDQVKARLDEFKKLLKLCADYSAQL